MTENRRVTSTARRIRRAWFFKIFWTYVWVDAAIIALLAAFIVYTAETAELGQGFAGGVTRWLTADHRLTGWAFIESLAYHFSLPEGGAGEIYLKTYIDMVYPCAVALAWFEGAGLFFGYFSIRRKTRELLRPLDQMALAARALTDSQEHIDESRDADGEKLHDLEEALSRMSPNRPEETLHTGDRDLEGLEDAINSLLKRMHASYQQQARFVSDASHELRTPIAVIQGYANMLDRWGKTDENVLNESIGAIKSEADYMKKLVEQLLFLARGDIGRNKLEFKDMSLAEMMREVSEECKLIDSKHEYRLETDERARAQGDVTTLKQCARILAENAAKYTPEGGLITLRARVTEKGEAAFEVQDSGIGISDADMAHIFDRFYRSDPARSRNSGGTGLGLSIAKWIVDRHKGHIDVLSREGLGTRFSVCLSASKPESDASAGGKR